MSTDPHLSAIIPAFWQLNELIWEEKYVIGAALVGCPGISMGRSKDMTWGLTASIVDNSDLWEEELSKDGKQYLVDETWRDLSVREEVIKIKGKDDLKLKVKSTHRGPLIELPELRFMSNLLFGGSIPPMHDTSHSYSFGWGGSYKGDHSMQAMKAFSNSQTVPEFQQTMYDITRETGYRGIAANILLADNSGNIAYQLAVPFPVRKD